MQDKIRHIIDILKQNPNEYISKEHTIRLIEVWATEDKKAPDIEMKIELIFVGIETMMFSAFLQGKENGQFKNWYERNGMKESFKRTIEEYLKLKK